MTELVQFTPFVATQGSADANVEATIQTGLIPGVDLSAWEIQNLEFSVSAALLKTWAAADAHLIVQLTKRSLAGGFATLDYSDSDLLTQFQIAAIASGTAANLILQPTTFLLELPPGMVAYTNAIFVQVMSAGSGVANRVSGRLLYQPRKLTQAEALAIVASRP